MRKETLFYAEPWIDDDDINGVMEVLNRGFKGALPTVREYETKFAEYVDAKYAVAFINGTAALHACAFAAGISKGDEVITTPMTFAATSNCVLYCGGTPIFADIQEDTYNIDPEHIREKITKKTKAIMPVHYTGQPADMDSINAIAEEHGLTVIEDACHAVGATYKDRMIGSISVMNVFSTHPVKQINTFEGGMITTNDREIYEKLAQFRNHGITRDPKKLKLRDEDGDWVSDQQYLGHNYRFNDLQAALGISQLKKLDKFLSIRKKYVDMYNKAFKNVEGLTIPYQSPDGKSSWHIYVLKLNTEKIGKSRKQVFNELKAKHNIAAAVHYVPVYYHTYYQNLRYKRGICPTAEDLYNRIITLPLFPKMTENDVEYVIDSVKDVLKSDS
ncbi:MAG: UDP-4-amino-4,6-dideoxy-N-acetyl-beta-L-altrosamine transaminase [Candidatus Altiarchaeota archaeon]